MIVKDIPFLQSYWHMDNPSTLPSNTLLHKNNKSHFQIKGERLFLRPYARRFVEQYHGWFVEDEQLLYLTGSQPLSLQEEYENHQSWLIDPLKYTFLIFNHDPPKETMVGDINLFFSQWIQPNQAEINIMIARKDQRGKGFAREALLLVQAFARVQYGRNEIIAKIKDDNAASMRLFEKMGYQLFNHSEHFQETEYRKQLDQPIEEYQKVLAGMEEVLDLNALFGQ